MKSERQKKIDKHAKVVKTRKKRRFLALALSVLIIMIPVCIKYLA